MLRPGTRRTTISTQTRWTQRRRINVVVTVGDTAFDRLWLILDDPKEKIDPQ